MGTESNISTLAIGAPCVTYGLKTEQILHLVTVLCYIICYGIWHIICHVVCMSIPYDHAVWNLQPVVYMVFEINVYLMKQEIT